MVLQRLLRYEEIGCEHKTFDVTKVSVHQLDSKSIDVCQGH